MLMSNKRIRTRPFSSYNHLIRVISGSDFNQPVTKRFPKVVVVKSIRAVLISQQYDQGSGKNIEAPVRFPVPDAKSDQNNIG